MMGKILTPDAYTAYQLSKINNSGNASILATTLGPLYGAFVAKKTVAQLEKKQSGTFLPQEGSLPTGPVPQPAPVGAMMPISAQTAFYPQSSYFPNQYQRQVWSSPQPMRALLR